MRAVSTVASGLRRSAVAIAEALVVAAIIAALLLALSPVYQPADFLAGTESAQAAKGGNGGGGGGGKGGGKPPASAATLSVTPNPAPAGGTIYTVSGSGFGSNQMVAISLANPGCCLAFNVLASSTGTLSFTATTGSPGTYYITAIRYGSTTVLARTSFVVN
jgi:hypothetical protein